MHNRCDSGRTGPPTGGQPFAIAHLRYLNLVAQSGTQRLLADVRDLLKKLVGDALDELPGLDDGAAPDAADPEDLEDDIDPDEPTDDEPLDDATQCSGGARRR